MNPFLTLLTLAAIVPVGMALALSQFCMVRAVLGVREGAYAPARCVLAISLAIALSLQLLALVQGGEPRPSYAPSSAVLLGGLVFGIAARANGGCYIGSFNELCRGHGRRLYTVAGWVLGFALLRVRSLPPHGQRPWEVALVIAALTALLLGLGLQAWRLRAGVVASSALGNVSALLAEIGRSNHRAGLQSLSRWRGNALGAAVALRFGLQGEQLNLNAASSTGAQALALAARCWPLGAPTPRPAAPAEGLDPGAARPLAAQPPGRRAVAGDPQPLAATAAAASGSGPPPRHAPPGPPLSSPRGHASGSGGDRRLAGADQRHAGVLIRPPDPLVQSSARSQCHSMSTVSNPRVPISSR